jgi:hypothetical protein
VQKRRPGGQGEIGAEDGAKVGRPYDEQGLVRRVKAARFTHAVARPRKRRAVAVLCLRCPLCRLIFPTCLSPSGFATQPHAKRVDKWPLISNQMLLSTNVPVCLYLQEIALRLILAGYRMGIASQNLVGLMVTSAAIVVRSPRTRSRVSNGSKLVAGVDGRSADARRYRDLVMNLTDDIGGASNLSEAQRTLVSQAAALVVQAERLHGQILRGEFVDNEQLTRLSNAATRVLSRLGLKRRARDAKPDLATYLALVAARPGCE